MSKKSRTHKIRGLYATFIVIIGVCIVLFVLNVVSPAEPLYLSGLSEQTKDYGVIVTDLHSSTPLYTAEHPIQGLSEGLSGTANISRFDVHVMSDDIDRLYPSGGTWCTVLQVFSVLSAVAMTILIVMALVSFYVNVRRGKVFPKKHIKWLVWAGVLMIAMSLSMDVSTAIEQTLAAKLLRGSDWQPAVNYSIHLTRILFGLTMIFTAELFYIGRDMQEDQELTI